MTTLLASDLADHPYVDIVYHGLPMDVAESEHVRADRPDGGDLQIHRITRLCPVCGAGAITTLLIPVSSE